MDISALETELIQLMTEEKFEEAEAKKKSVIPWLLQALSNDVEKAHQCLTLLSKLAGDADSFENFSRLLDDLEIKKLISTDQCKQLIESSPIKPMALKLLSNK